MAMMPPAVGRWRDYLELLIRAPEIIYNLAVCVWQGIPRSERLTWRQRASVRDDVRRLVRGVQAPMTRGHDSMLHTGPGMVPSDRVRIWDPERNAYWRPGGRGFTTDAAEAGTWGRDEAEVIVADLGPPLLELREV